MVDSPSASPDTARRRLATITPGETIRGRAVTIGEWHVMTFAGLTGDFYPLHTDAEFAASTQFGERIAHGLLTFVVGAGFLANELAGWEVVAALGFGRTRFIAPVKFGDTVAPTATVTDVTTKNSNGIVDLDIEITNQHRTTVVTSSMQVLVAP